MENRKFTLVDLLAAWRKRLHEAAEKGENLDDVLLQAEKDLEAAGFRYAISLLRREALRLKLLGPIFRTEPPPAPPVPPRGGATAPPWSEIQPVKPPEVGPVPSPLRQSPGLLDLTARPPSRQAPEV